MDQMDQTDHKPRQTGFWAFLAEQLTKLTAEQPTAETFEDELLALLE